MTTWQRTRDSVSVGATRLSVLVPLRAASRTTALKTDGGRYLHRDCCQPSILIHRRGGSGLPTVLMEPFSITFDVQQWEFIGFSHTVLHPVFLFFFFFFFLSLPRPHHPRGIVSVSNLQTMAGCQSAVESTELWEIKGLGRPGELEQQGGGSRLSRQPSRSGQQQRRATEQEVKNYSEPPLWIHHLAHPEPTAAQRPADQRRRQPGGGDEGHHRMSGTFFGMRDGIDLVFLLLFFVFFFSLCPDVNERTNLWT